jgi:hypothetical protein
VTAFEDENAFDAGEAADVDKDASAAPGIEVSKRVWASPNGHSYSCSRD